MTQLVVLAKQTQEHEFHHQNSYLKKKGMMMPFLIAALRRLKTGGSMGLTGQPASPTWREVQARKIPCLKKVRGMVSLA